ncbi:hypothetical protein ACIGXM_15645 [Kitasatospora sp. NPDC052896]|uniref:hypothetical protein n=1 Tax=Kitasatospora sp. NPDC052896 TaxID=3364061 RepID=UPI0037CB03C0
MPTGGQAAQLFDYQHNANNGFGVEVSRIPNDCTEFGGRTYIQYTSVAQWPTRDNPLPAGHDGSPMSGVDPARPSRHVQRRAAAVRPAGASGADPVLRRAHPGPRCAARRTRP